MSIPVRNINCSMASIPLVILSLMGIGYLIASSATQLITKNYFVTVKGSAEKSVQADLVVWPITHTVGGSSLTGIQTHLEKNTRFIRQFLLDSGFKDEEIIVSTPRVEDKWRWNSTESRPAERFSDTMTIILRTHLVEEAISALRRSGILISHGIQLVGNDQPEFKFTQLNAIKPALIAEATTNARRSAEQFAKDSGSRLGRIRTANQGQISITDRDVASPQIKIIRVVSTIEYLLKN